MNRQRRRAAVHLALTPLLALLLSACASADPSPIENSAEPTAAPTVVIVSGSDAPAAQSTHASSYPSSNETEAVYSTTTGLALPSDFIYRPVMAVVDNTAQARPQTGLMLADVIYEYPLDRSDHGTRFLALFSDTIPSRVGPIRDWRSYMAQTALEWDAMLIASGDPPSGDTPYQTRAETGLRRMLTNEDAASPVYYRDETVSSDDSLTLFCKASLALEQLYGSYATDVDERFQFERGVSYEHGRRVVSVGLPFTSSDRDKVVFDYDEETNRFVRSEKNSKGVLTACKTLTPTDSDPGYVSEPVTVSNLIVQYVRVTAQDTVYRGIRLTGTGVCDFFINGCHVAGTWSRPTPADTTVYALADGTPIRLEPGNTWIALEPESHPVRILYVVGEP